MKVSLFQIEQEYINIAEQLIETQGELTPELEQALAINKDQLAVKSAGYGFVVKQANHDITAIDSEIKRLQALKKSREKMIERLEGAVKSAMELYGYEKLESNTLKISLTKSTETIIENPDLIPRKYKTKEITYKISKADIKNDLNAGKKVKGAYLLNKKNIQFK